MKNGVVPARATDKKRKVKYPALVVKDARRRRMKERLKSLEDVFGMESVTSSPVEEEISLTALTGRKFDPEKARAEIAEIVKSTAKKSRASDYFRNRLERVAQQSETDRIHHGMVASAVLSDEQSDKIRVFRHAVQEKEEEQLQLLRMMEKRSSELEETRKRANDLKRRVEIYAEMYEKKKRKKNDNKQRKGKTFSPQRTPLMVARNKLRKLKRQRSLIQRALSATETSLQRVLIETKSAVREKRSLLAFRAALGRIKEEQKYRSARKTTDIVVLYEKEDEESRDTKKNDQETGAMEDCFVNLMNRWDQNQLPKAFREAVRYVFNRTSSSLTQTAPQNQVRRRRREAAIAADAVKKKTKSLALIKTKKKKKRMKKQKKDNTTVTASLRKHRRRLPSLPMEARGKTGKKKKKESNKQSSDPLHEPKFKQNLIDIAEEHFDESGALNTEDILESIASGPMAGKMSRNASAATSTKTKRGKKHHPQHRSRPKEWMNHWLQHSTPMTNSSPSGIDGLKDARITYSPKLDTASYEAVSQLRQQLRRHSIGASQLFTFMDKGRTNFVSFREFKRGLALAGVYPSSSELRNLFNVFDKDRT